MDSWYMKWAAVVICSMAGYTAYEVVPWSDAQTASWAGWVQAFGAIAAIIGAYLVGERQANWAAKHALRMQEQAELKRRAAHLAIATAARDYAAEIGQNFFHGGVNKIGLFMAYHEQIAVDYITAMNAVPIHELGSADSVKAWFATKNAMLYFKEALVFYVDHVNEDAGGEPEERAGNPGAVVQCTGYVRGCYSALAFVMQPAEQSNHL